MDAPAQEPQPRPMALHEWQDALEDLARRAEVAGPDVSLTERQELAGEWFRHCWLALSPDLVARSARVSARLNEPLLADPGPLDRQVLASQFARLTGLQSVGALTRAHAEIAAPTLDFSEPEPEPEPPAPVAASRPALRPRAERMRMERLPLSAEEDALAAARREARQQRIEAPPPPMPRVEQARPLIQDPPPTGWVTGAELARLLDVSAGAISQWKTKRLIPPACMQEAAGRTWFDPETPLPLGEHALKSAPDGWLSAAEVAELLNVSAFTIGRRRIAGQLGEFPADWARVGRSYFFNPEAVEALESRLRDELPAVDYEEQRTEPCDPLPTAT